MIKLVNFFCILFLPIFITAQSTAQKTWIVDLSKQRSSFDGVRIDKIELNEKNTVVHMSFTNMDFTPQHIEACNTFHIRADGKKVARFVRAENIPTRDTKREGFSCADIERAMRIKPGQFLRFRVFFTRIPEDLNRIDVIEYDGKQSCEFDVYNLNISSKEPLTSSTPSVAAAKSPIKKTDSATQKPKKENKPVKKVNPTPSNTTVASASKPETTQTKPTQPANEISAPKFDTRSVNVRKEYITTLKTLRLEIWDNDQEDGDLISIMLNGHLIAKNYAVRKAKRKLEIPLQEGENVLTFHAENLGKAPPNTAALSFFDGQDSQTIILNSNMAKSEAVRIIKN